MVQLLTLGDVREQDEWLDYAALSQNADHTLGLIRMALDKEIWGGGMENCAGWAYIHAWRALGQLRAVAAAEPLITLFDYLDEENEIN